MHGSDHVRFKLITKRNTVRKENMIAQILSKENMIQAYNQVRKNKGAAGIDGKSVDDLSAYLREHWPFIKHQIESGSYQPAPILGVEIPKHNGKTRLLSIPTVGDRGYIKPCTNNSVRFLSGTSVAIVTVFVPIAMPIRLSLRRWKISTTVITIS